MSTEFSGIGDVRVVIHPKAKPSGEPLVLSKPSVPSHPLTWNAPWKVAVFVPAGMAPASLNGVALNTKPLPEMAITDLAYAHSFDEPAYSCPTTHQPAAGTVVLEADGRAWVVHPSNGFGGLNCVFPKGRTDGAGLRETAVRETYEESGLLVELVGFLGDSTRSVTHARFYLARRVAGTPVEMGWESQAVSLAPLALLVTMLDSPHDQQLAKRILARVSEGAP